MTLGGVIPNPDVELVREGIALARREGVELVLCVGGGSVIDSGKGIALGLKNPDLDIWDVYEKQLETAGAYPVACLLTFPAAGSEASNSTVLSNYKTQKKCGYNREHNRPVLSVIDPTLFESIPKFQIAAGVADMMSHIFERYFSNTEHTELSDALSEATLRTLLAFGEKVVNNPADYDSWCQVALSGTIAHNNMLGVGREQDWACHKLGHELTARFGVTHGAGLAVLTPRLDAQCLARESQAVLQFFRADHGAGGSAQGRRRHDRERHLRAGDVLFAAGPAQQARQARRRSRADRGHSAGGHPRTGRQRPPFRRIEENLRSGRKGDLRKSDLNPKTQTERQKLLRFCVMRADDIRFIVSRGRMMSALLCHAGG